MTCALSSISGYTKQVSSRRRKVTIAPSSTRCKICATKLVPFACFDAPKTCTITKSPLEHNLSSSVVFPDFSWVCSWVNEVWTSNSPSLLPNGVALIPLVPAVFPSSCPEASQPGEGKLLCDCCWVLSGVDVAITEWPFFLLLRLLQGAWSLGNGRIDSGVTSWVALESGTRATMCLLKINYKIHDETIIGTEYWALWGPFIDTTPYYPVPTLLN